MGRSANVSVTGSRRRCPSVPSNQFICQTAGNTGVRLEKEREAKLSTSLSLVTDIFVKTIFKDMEKCTCSHIYYYLLVSPIIFVLDSPVILESPVLPVMEGEAVTLRCRNKMTSSAHIADFFKDHVLIGTRSIGEMTIQSVSKADEGLYKCSVSDFGESPESWLAVRGET